MIDHIGFPVSDIERSKAFYSAALAPLGYNLMMSFDTPNGPVAGFGRAGKPTFWLSQGEPPKGMHVALRAGDRAAVDAFYAEALAAGATDNGKPGLRPMYHADYYGAFVRDPDGINVEAVIHTAEPSEVPV